MAADALDLFVEQADLIPWRWSHVDCCMALADWVMACGWPDMLAEYRGAYTSESEAQAVVEAHDGLSAYVGTGAAGIGLMGTTDPQRGDIAVVGSPTKTHLQWGAICTGRRWLIRRNRGFEPIIVHRPLAAWSVPLAAAHHHASGRPADSGRSNMGCGRQLYRRGAAELSARHPAFDRPDDPRIGTAQAQGADA